MHGLRRRSVDFIPRDKLDKGRSKEKQWASVGDGEHTTTTVVVVTRLSGGGSQNMSHLAVRRSAAARGFRASVTHSEAL